MNGASPEVVQLGNGITEKDLLVHDQYNEKLDLAMMLSRFEQPEFPLAMGVLRSVSHPTYDGAAEAQVQAEIQRKGKGDLYKLLHSGETWEVSA